MLVHGFTQTGASFEPVARRLESSHEVILPDLPGHGDSPLPGGGLADAARVLGESCGRATYVGYSLGGRVCLHLALGHPSSVERLILTSTTAGIEDAAARQSRVESDDALADRIEEGGDAGISSFLDEWLSGPLFAQLDEDAANRPARLGNTAAGLAASLRQHGTGTQLPLWEQLGGLEMPVLLVAGAEDARFVDNAARMAAAIGANAFSCIVPDAGHAVPFEQPEVFARLVADFIAGRTPVA